MNYIDMVKLYSKIIALYCRVSTAGQDISKQITLAEVYLTQNKIPVDSVIHFIDHNVSANKRTFLNRPELQKLLKQIKAGNVGVLLVQTRDRLARNFYEYVELVKILHQYKVKVIFTDSGQPPFSDILAMEALYGIFPQFDGQTNARRTQQTRLRYPNALLGFHVKGKKRDKHYVPNPDKAVELKSFFVSVMNCRSLEGLIEILIKHKNLFKTADKALSTLQNPFYAGHYKYQDEYVSLPHVEPIISLKDFLIIQDVYKKYEQELHNAIQRSSNNGIYIPICHICKQPMHFRSTKLGESGNYVCSKKHPKIQIEVNRFNQLILNHLQEMIQKIRADEIKKDVSKHLLQLEKQYKQNLAYLQNQLNTTHREMTELIGINQPTALKKLIAQETSIKKKMIYFDTLLQKINNARREIDTLSSLVKNRITEELQNYEIDFLSKLLFSKIEVSPEALIYHMTFGNYIEGNDMNEY